MAMRGAVAQQVVGWAFLSGGLRDAPKAHRTEADEREDGGYRPPGMTGGLS